MNSKKDAILEQRYGKQYTPDSIQWNNTIESILSHRSIRNFLSDSLPLGTIETMVAAAQSASVSGNLQQWSVIAVTDKLLKEKLAKISRKAEGAEGNYYIEQAPVLLLWVADLSRNNILAKESGAEAEIHNYLDSFLMSSIDTALAAQNAALVAESLGLGIVYIGAMRNQAEEIAKLMELPPYSYVTFGMVVGKPDPAFAAQIRPRISQDLVLHFNKYHKMDTSLVEAYEDDFKSFRIQSGMKEKTWLETISIGANSLAYMGGRENLRSALLKQGFGLK
jgi:Nitroreductase